MPVWGQYDHFVGEGSYNISSTDPITCQSGASTIISLVKVRIVSCSWPGRVKSSNILLVSFLSSYVTLLMQIVLYVCVRHTRTCTHACTHSRTHAHPCMCARVCMLASVLASASVLRRVNVCTKSMKSEDAGTQSRVRPRKR